MAESELEEIKKLVKGAEFFEPFTDAEIDELLQISSYAKFELNKVIIREAKYGHRFYVIIKGAAKIVKGLGGDHSQTLAILTAGDCVGEIAMLLDEPRTATVIAGVDCHVFEVEGDFISRLSQQVQTKLYRQFAINLAKRLMLSSMR